MEGAGLVVLYEDECMLVVEKPAGMHTAPLRRDEPGTLLEKVIHAYPQVASVPGVKTVEPGLVHRLDRETSGAVVIARTPAAFAALRASFQAGEVRKTYRAACSCPAAGLGRGERRIFGIESRFAPWGPGRRMVRVVPPAGVAGSAVRGATRDMYRTDAEVMETAGELALVRAFISRGFRHQVRAHLAFLGFPILGDPLYGSPVPPGSEGRMYLHAERIEMKHPVSGAPLAVECPAPASFAAVVLKGSKGVTSELP